MDAALSRRDFVVGSACLAVDRTPRATFDYADPVRRGVPPRVDVSVPDPARGAVFLVHGGGFVVGSRRMPAVRSCADALTAAGFAAIAVDYRLLGRGGRFTEALDDMLAAARWWRGVAQSFGVPDRVGWVGHSAGAALAAIAATESGALAWVGVYGPYDFRRLPGQPTVHFPTRWLLETTEPAELWAASPLARATAPIPTLLFHGTRDGLVPIAHAEALVAARGAGLPVELRRVDAAHGYLQRPRSLAARRTVDELVAFFAEALGR